MTTPKKPNGFLLVIQRIFSGCLAVLATLFLLLILIFLSIEVRLQGVTLLIVTVCGIFVLIYLWRKVGKKVATNTGVFKLMLSSLVRTIIVVIIFSVVMTVLSKKAGYVFESEKNNSETEVITATEEGKQIRYIVNTLKWKDFDGENHQMQFKIADADVKKSEANRKAFKYTRQFTWGDFYKHLANHDRQLLDNLYKTLAERKKEKNMDRYKFAEFVITSIQNIQYNYIKTTPCDGTEDFPCVGNIPLGVLAPVEFSAGMRGDCDTRTVLLFVVLAKFGYEVAILNSDEYKHSVLGIHLPYRGKYKIYNRKKYYIVETTATGYPIGKMPVNMSTLSFWDFVLVN